MKTITVYSDAGHAWAKIKRSELIELKILGDISSFSYQRGEHVYLEEDSDLSLLVNRLHELEIEYKFFTRYSNTSRVRSYDNFSA